METKTHSQSGFALILAILALMLLTFLGLTLSATTSTELQIASNYRWSQQAYYNAEAGIEAGKIVLRNIQPDWSKILPAPRTTVWGGGSGVATPKCNVGGAGCAAPAGSRGTRNWEGVECDNDFGTGYGVVLDDAPAAPLLNGQVPAPGAYEHVTNFLGTPIRGAFTLWVRREVIRDKTAGGWRDYKLANDGAAGDTTLVLTAEGVAPVAANALNAYLSPRAVRLLQVRLSYSQPGSPCDSAEGQAGTTASGANFGACSPLGNGSIGAALGAGGGGGGDTGAK